MSNKNNVTVAIIGCGKGGEGIGCHSIGYEHANVYTHNGDSIVGACDLDSDNLARFAETYNVPHASEDLETMLADAKPEMVSICTYAGSHLAIFRKCAEAGVKAVFMEKPLCLTKSEGVQILQIAKDYDIKVVVNHYRRYVTRATEVKAKLDEGAIGTPIFYFAGINDWDLMEWGTHWLDMFRFLSGDQEIAWVLGQAEVTDKFAYGHPMEDHALAYIGFADGSKALLDGGKAFNGNIAIRVVGTEGILEIPDFSTAYFINHTGRVEFGEGTSIHSDPDHAAWIRLLDDFACWRNGGPEPQCGLSNALKSTELYLAAYESAVQRGRIIPPLDPSQKDFPLNQLSKNK